MPDSSLTFLPVIDWLGGEGADPRAAAERRAESLLAANFGLLRDFGVVADVVRRGGEPGLSVRTSTRVGAFPLLSPLTARPDFGLVIEPRFAWASAGEMLAGTGFRVVPELLPLPEPPQSERRVPPWVLSSIILPRLARLLDAEHREFRLVEEDRRSPRGAIRWPCYATRRMPLGRVLDLPCRYPDLREDDDLRAGIHWVLRRQKDSLLGQSSAGLVVRRLLALCDSLIGRVAGSPPRQPTVRIRQTWMHRPVSSRVFLEGLQAIDWTIDERGLGGLSDLSGLAWWLDMECFFEAWVEAIAERTARLAGARLRVGRREETRRPLEWRPPGTGSQRSLLPDIVIERDDTVLVLDAKYKRHAEQIERLGWFGADETLREQHRADVLQALAYSTLFDAPRVIACLVYPAAFDTWQRLADQNRVVSRAAVRTGSRCVELALLAVPLSGRVEPPAAWLDLLLRREA